jgi:hypothetical protein
MRATLLTIALLIAACAETPAEQPQSTQHDAGRCLPGSQLTLRAISRLG